MEGSGPDFEEKIINDPLMQQEMFVQNGIISYLANIDQLTSADIDTLLQLQIDATGTLKYPFL